MKSPSSHNEIAICPIRVGIKKSQIPWRFKTDLPTCQLRAWERRGRAAPRSRNSRAAPGQAARTDLSTFTGWTQRPAQRPARSTPAPATPGQPGLSAAAPLPLAEGDPTCTAGPPLPALTVIILLLCRRAPRQEGDLSQPQQQHQHPQPAHPHPAAGGPARPLPTPLSLHPPRPSRHAAPSDWLLHQHVLDAAANQQSSRGPPARGARVLRDPWRPR